MLAELAFGDSRVASMPISYEPDELDITSVGALSNDAAEPEMTCEISKRDP